MIAVTLTRARVLIAAVAAAVISAIWWLLTAHETPEDVVRAYFDAAVHKDCATAFAQLGEPMRSTVVDKQRLCARAEGDDLRYARIVGHTTLRTDSAKVTVELVRPNGTLTDEVTMTLVNGHWKIASFEVIQSNHGHK